MLIQQNFANNFISKSVNLLKVYTAGILILIKIGLEKFMKFIILFKQYIFIPEIFVHLVIDYDR
jgi:hypothetical protein